jgi:Phage Mu protein F like protein
MSQPVWSGRGQDPWLPDRLDAKLNAGAAERALRQAYWAALSGWLVETARRVQRGGRPDLDAIWARAPQWQAAVQQVVDGAVRPAMAAGYATLLGRGFPWEQRAFVSSYLAEVTNRMVRVPDQVFDLVAGQVAQAVNLGEGLPAIVDRVDNVLSTTTSQRWPNRATVTARTEAIGALNASRFDAFRAVAEEMGDPFEKIWLATLGPRTRASHAAADGQQVLVNDPFVVGGYNLQFPGDPGGPAEEVIQCRCSLLLVEPGETTDMSNRQFLGE